MKKILAIGEEGFLEMIRGNRYYVDKTGFIKPIMESGSYVQLITRPRRFGKTLFMGMLETFLELNLTEPGNTALQEELFAGLAVRRDTAFCHAYMGRFPVLSVTLKDVKGLSFDDAMQRLAEELQPIAEHFASLLTSPRLSDEDKAFLKNCISRRHMLDPAHRTDLQSFLGRMSLILARHFEQPIVLLIDEYDVPLQKSLKGGYYPKMLTFLQGFLSCLKPGSAMKLPDRRHAIQKAVLTGCLRVSKASLFTDLNSFDVDSVCVQGSALAAAVGFTADEVQSLLAYYDLTDKTETVRNWYDGYRIGEEELYCPWDVIHFCRDIQAPKVNRATFQPENYWSDTSSNDAIDEFLGFLQPEDADRMQALYDGKAVEITDNHQLTYDDFANHESADFWTLLLFTGYLTVVSRVNPTTFQVRIPNNEVRNTFRERIQARYSRTNRNYLLTGEEMARAALAGDAPMLKKILLQILKKYVSVRDFATRAPAENYYHGLLVGLFSSVDLLELANLDSNRESGDGYPDITFTSCEEDVGVVIEIKRCEPQDKLRYAQAALRQIEEKHYADGLTDFGCSRFWGIGIAFSGRTCAVVIKALQPNH